jgi:hypothetical protein
LWYGAGIRLSKFNFVKKIGKQSRTLVKQTAGIAHTARKHTSEKQRSKCRFVPG